jgi:AbrB family looped-hinge helix DNA binding protein
MPKRLQVIFSDVEYRELQRSARRERMTVSEWVRKSLREQRVATPIADSGKNPRAVREATRHAFTAAGTSPKSGDAVKGSIDKTVVVQRSAGPVSVVTVSPKYQVVIPRRIREALGLAPGQQVQVFEYEGRVEFVPVRPLASWRGFLPGLNTTVTRERDRT